ncbi:MAG: EF-P 5-aminopentanol modification-associated protein YfmF [Eubacteriales bacterium]
MSIKPIKTDLGGGTLLTLNTDKFKTELVTVTFPMPFEPVSARLCSLMLSVLKQGCRRFPDIGSLSRRLDDLYDANIATMFDRSGDNVCAGFVCECLGKSYVPDGTDIMFGTLETLSDMIFDPLLSEGGFFPHETVENEKKILCDNIRASDSDPRIHSYQLCRGIMCGGEPYGLRLLGSKAEVEKITREDVTAYLGEFVSSYAPNIIYIGERTREEAEKLVFPLAARLGKSAAALNKTILKRAPSHMRFAEEKMPVSQGKLTVGFRSDLGLCDPDLYAAIVFNDIFGGSSSSKLFRNVREKQSLCYSCSSTFDFTKGVLYVRSGISSENKERVQREILKQFEEIKRGNISDYEFECSKKAIENSYLQVDDSALSLESYYRIRLLGGLCESVDTALERLSHVTKEDVIRAARRFAPDTSAFIHASLPSGGEKEEFADE